MAYVYRHIRLDKNIPFYIGIGSDTKGQHNRAYRQHNRSRHWHNIVNKHGYLVEILHDNIDWDTACILEQQLISIYGRMDLQKGDLVNLTNGGDGVLGVIIVAWNKGEQFSEEWKNKLKAARVGKESNAKGKKWTEEAKERIRIARKDNMPSTKGIKFTEERRLSNKYGKARRGVLQFDLNNNLIKAHYSLNDAAQETIVPKSSIYLGCMNNREYGGFRWGYEKSLQTEALIK